MELKRVVVTGLGAITPLGNTLPETWEGIINGKSGAGPITQFDASKFKTQFACEVKGFDPLTVMDRKEARKCDRYSLFAINAAKQAIDDAAMDLDKEDKNRIGVIFASGIGGIKTFDEEVLGYAKIKDTIGQSVLHTEDDFRYCSRTYLHALRIPWSQLCDSISLCIFNQRDQ